MALNKSIIALPIDKGLNTKMDPKQDEPGYLRRAENVVYETLKLLKKRNGYDQIPLTLLDGSQISDVLVSTKYKKELVLMNKESLYAYSPSLSTFTKKGTVYPTEVKSKAIIRNANEQTKPSGLLIENFEIYAWEDSSGGVHYSVMDTVNKNFLVADQEVSVTGFRPILSNIQNSVYIIYGDTTNIKFRKFELSEPGTLGAEVTSQSNLNASTPLIDATSAQNYIFVTYNSTAAEVSIYRIDASDSSSSSTSLTGEDASVALTVLADAQHRVIFAWSDGLTLRYAIYPFTLASQILAPTQIAAVADVCNIGIAQKMDYSGYKIFWEVSDTEPENHKVSCAEIDVVGTITNVNNNFMRSVGLASKPFVYNNIIFVTVIHDSQLQPTYFVIDENAKLVNKFSNQNASGVSDAGVLVAVFQIDDNSFLITNQVKGRSFSNNNAFYSLLGVNSTTLNFAPVKVFKNAFLAENLHICSGVLKMYDGAVVVEHGFNVFPETLTNAGTATTGGSMGDGNYSYAAVYRWTDNTGRDHMSAPTPVALDIILSGGTSTQTQSIGIPTLRITEKVNVVLDLYRTEADGTVYYKVTDNLDPVFSDPTVDSITIVDGISDTDLIKRELLYTTGGVIENIVAPSSGIITTYQGRLAVVGEDSNKVTFSKQVEEGKPVEFTDLITADFDPIGGEITEIASMDDKFIAYESDATFCISGDGLSNTLQGNPFSKPELLASDLGCINSSSTVYTPLGIMFKSRKGIWLLGKNLAFNYVGDKVEEFNNMEITSAQTIGELNQIRFLTTDNIALVYNYNLDRWATFQNHGGISSVVIENDYYYIREDGILYKENRSSFSDSNSPIKFKVETSWLYLMDIQGFQRVYHALILGNYESAHKLRVKIAYNFVDAFVDEVVISAADFIDATPYGGYSPYGSPDTIGYGGNLDQNLYQMRVDLARQKCTAIKISIEDAQDTVGEGLSLSALTFKVGLKTGEFAMPATNKYGAT